VARNISQVGQQEEEYNTGLINQFAQIDVGISNREIDAQAQNKGQVLKNRSEALDNLTRSLTGSLGTSEKYRIQKQITEMLGSKNWEIKNGKLVFKEDSDLDR